MSDAPLDEIEIRNREALEELAQTIEWSVGEFHLLLARCNYGSVRSHLLTRLLEICPVRIQVVTLTAHTEKLYTTIREAIADQNPEAVIVIGFEHVHDLDKLFAAADSAREEFRKNFAFPLVFWLDDGQFNGFKNRAPNFESWAPVDTPVFAIAPTAILQSLEQGRNAVFEAAFDPQEKDLPDAIGRITHLGDLQRSELPNALQFLEDQGIGLRADLQADLDFIQGCHLSRRNSAPLEAIEAAIEYFQNTITHYRTYLPTILIASNAPVPESTSNLKLAVALFFLGRCQFQHIDLARRTSYLSYKQSDWELARASLAEAVMLFDQCDRPDMTAKIILRLVRTLRRLEDWDALEVGAKRAIVLHDTYEMPTRAGEPYGFLAEVALHREQWLQARDYAQQALRAIAPLPPAYQWPEGLYLSFQARAEAKLGHTQVAIDLLERARELGDRGHPTTYCRTLEALRELYWQQKRYLDAFKLKQARLEVEKIAGIRAFVGAVRLGAQARLLEEANNPDDLAPEIRASGRQLDLQRLLERIGRNDFKLTVIHGSSGVGKSSLMNAGLIPTLKGRAIGTRENRVVLVRKYTDWAGSLSAQVAEVFAPRPLQLPDSPTSTLNQVLFTTASAKSSEPDQIDPRTETQRKMLSYILQQLRECDDQNLRPILIFDQFEEFFFANPNAIDRRRFFEFLGDCLQIPFINVILSLREDYIHHLLEANKVKGLGAIGSDILSNNVLYGLGNFSPSDAKAIIEDLTGRSRLYLEPNLIDALVNDLAGELREVRPIELQVVGAQLETENIHTLADYQALGPKPKEELVTRYLQEVVQDCGEEYAALAARVLYELTDERGTRPLKTHPELQRELEAANFPIPNSSANATDSTDSLDYVLRMLSGSGIVMYLPEQPSDRYQLIHDYIAEAVREKYAPNAAAELAVEREKRMLAESLQQQTAAELQQAQKKNLEAQRRLVVASIVLATSLAVAGFSVPAAIIANRQAKQSEIEINQVQKERDFIQKEKEIAEQERLRANKARDFAEQERKDIKDEATKLIRENKEAQNQLQGTRQQFILAQRSEALARQTLLETQTLQQQAEEAAKKAVAERDSTIQEKNKAEEEQRIAREVADLERRSGHLYTLFDRSAPPTSDKAVAGQLESLLLAVQIGTELQALVSSDVAITSYPTVSPIFGLQQQLLRGQERNRFRHDREVMSTSFSPDGHQILTGSNDGTARLWNTNGDLIHQFYHSKGVKSVGFSPDGRQILTSSDDGTVRLWNMNGNLMRQFQHTEGVTQAKFSPNGQLILTGSMDGTAKLWTIDGKLLQTLQHNGAIGSIGFSPDGHQILTGARDGIATLWSLDGEQIRQFQHGTPIGSVSFSPDGYQILTGAGDGTVTLWRLDGTRVGHFQHEQGVNSVSFSPNGQQILTGSGKGIATLWRLDGSVVQQFEHGAIEQSEPFRITPNNQIYSVNFSPDGNQILIGSGSGTATLWQFKDEVIELSPHSSERWILSVSFSPDGNHVLTGSANGIVHLWRVDGTLIHEFRYDSPVNSLNFSSDGKTVLLGLGNGTTVLLNLEDYSTKQFESQYDSVFAAIFSPDGQKILTGTSKGTAIIWSLEGEIIRRLQHDSEVLSVSFSPDGNQILTGTSDGTATLWGLEGEIIRQFQHSSAVLSVSFSPDGNQILTGSWSGTGILWNQNGDSIQQFQQDSGIWSASFSPDGQQILTATEDGTVAIWSVNGELVQQFQQEGAVLSASFSPDGRRIIAGAGTGAAALYPIRSLPELIQSGCTRLSGFLSYNPTVTNRSRALCNLPPRATTPSEEHSHHPIERLTGFIRRWLGA